MDITKIKPNIAAVGKGFKVENDMWIAEGDMAITFPARYLSGAMGNLTDTYNPVGYFAIIVGNSYACHLVPMNYFLSPEKTSVYTHNDEEYLLLEWTKGGVICNNLRLAQNNSNIYQIHNEFISRGRTPWYFSVNLRSEIYRNNGKMAGVNLGGGIALESLLVASITRDKKDRRTPARYTYETQADYDRGDTNTIALVDISYGAQSGMARTVGGYAEEGIIAELIDPTESVDILEQLTRT